MTIKYDHQDYTGLTEMRAIHTWNLGVSRVKKHSSLMGHMNKDLPSRKERHMKESALGLGFKFKLTRVTKNTK